jgi:hypothetical protein
MLAWPCWPCVRYGGANGRISPPPLSSSLYALTDEFHQTFTPGRNGTLVDVAIDMSGALTCLWLVHWRQLTPQQEAHASVDTF